MTGTRLNFGRKRLGDGTPTTLGADDSGGPRPKEPRNITRRPLAVVPMVPIKDAPEPGERHDERETGPTRRASDAETFRATG